MKRRILPPALLCGALLASLLYGCDKEKLLAGLTEFHEGFERYDELDSLLTDEPDAWRATQVTLEGNSVRIDTSFAYAGTHSLLCVGKPTTDVLSKASLFKQDFSFFEGDLMRVSARYYLADSLEGSWLFIMDLEESTAIGAGPGTRLAIVDGALTLEHKYPRPSTFQPEATRVRFPHGQWVQVDMLLLLSQQRKGWITVYQDGVPVLHVEDWQTLPKDLLYFNQGSLGRYNSVELGVTANPTGQEVRLWVDEVMVTDH